MSEPLIFTAKLNEERDYWVQKLGRDLGESHIALDFKRSKVYSRKSDSVEIRLPAELSQQIEKFTGDSQFLLLTALMAALKICLRKHTGNTTIVVGTPVYRAEQTPDVRANVLAMVDEVADSSSFQQFLLGVRQTLSEAYARQSYPFEQIVKNLGIEALDNRCPILDVLLVLKNMHGDVPELRNDITVSFEKGESGITGEVSFNSRLFLRETIERFAGHLVNVLCNALADIKTPLWQIEILSEQERQQLLFDWNDTRRDYIPAVSVLELFEAQVAETPDSLAVIFRDERLSYRELNRRANQLAHRLRREGVTPDSCVGVCMERSVEMVVGLLGILKAGGAYVALDPSYPSERLDFMLKDSQMPVLLTQRKLSGQLPSTDAKISFFDDSRDSFPEERDENPAGVVTADNLAYVIYTSGSTGVPKGVSMPHGALVNLIQWQRLNSSLPPGARTLQFTSLSFDVSFQEIFSTWCAGGALVLISNDERRDIVRLPVILAEHKIERLFLPFIVLQELADSFFTNETASTSLKEVVTAGEQLHVTPAIVRLFRQLRECSLFNQYGPSETHVVTHFTLSEAPSRWPALPPIGRPVSNTQVYLLDTYLMPVPVGVAGEIYLGGDCLARGYLNRPDMTAEKFIPHPFSRDPQARLYRSGDLGRYRYDGELEFLGRGDDQVKIRGFRIEPGEVEAALARHPGVHEVAVVARADGAGERRLVAYVVARPGARVATRQLREHLRMSLPEYMVPGQFVELERMPLTPNGKVDRKALPEATTGRPDMDSTFVAPQTPTEVALAKIWSEVLQVERVGIHDNFFELGGHSLVAAQVVSRVRESFNVEIPLRKIFEVSTIAGLSQLIKAGEAASVAANSFAIESLPREENDIGSLIEILEDLSTEEVMTAGQQGQTE